MSKYFFPFKICDPIHGFIRFDELEKKMVDSRPFQRLRYIHQMGSAFLVYPGATHSRFEHSLGVMELAGNIFDVITHPPYLNRSLVKTKLPEDPEELSYWRKILRLAALCHDLGHLPFSHTAEKELLPEGGHERVTLALIQSDALKTLWAELAPSALEDILKLTVHEEELLELTGLRLNSWERVLSQVITDDNFGADRIDYLLRDSYFTGFGYGHFDYHQLIDSLRILPSIDAENEKLTIGVSQSGMQSVESLWIARYLLYARVYHLPKARIYSLHLKRFMEAYYREKGFPLDLEGYLRQTDYEILTAIAKAADLPRAPGHRDALALLNRGPSFREVPLGSFSSEFILKQSEQLLREFDKEIYIDRISYPKNDRHFSVETEEGRVVDSQEESLFLRSIPFGTKPLRIYASRDQFEKVKQRLQSK